MLKQYKEEVENVLLSAQDSNQGEKIDFISLRKRILSLMSTACDEGLRQKDFIEVVESALPGDIVGALHLRDFKAAA